MGTLCAMIDVKLTQTIQMHSVESEALQSWGYDVETHQMVLRFQNGKTFRYTGVPGDVAVQVIAGEVSGGDELHWQRRVEQRGGRRREVAGTGERGVR